MAINQDIAHLARPIGWFKPDARNARKHSPRNIRAIADSLRNFGQQKPVVALQDGTIIAGNGTLDAAKVLGMSELAVVVMEDEEAARAYAIADNRTAELAEWDIESLDAELKALAETKFSIEDVGFDEDVLKEIGVSAHTRTPPSAGEDGGCGDENSVFDVDALLSKKFAGSGTTGIGCAIAGVSFHGIEMEKEHADIIRARLEWWHGKLDGMAP